MTTMRLALIVAVCCGAAAALPVPRSRSGVYSPRALQRRWRDGESVVPLARGGKAAATVVLPAKPKQAELAAAAEFIRLVQRISGAELPVVNESTALPAGRALAGVHSLVYIGNVSALAAAGLSDLPQSLLPEGFAVVTRRTTNRSGAGPAALYLVGDDACQAWHSGDRGSPTANGPCRTGTLFGVVTFFRERFGCEWLWPGRLGEVVPSDPDLAVPAIPEVRGTAAVLPHVFSLVLTGTLGGWCAGITRGACTQVHSGGALRRGARRWCTDQKWSRQCCGGTGLSTPIRHGRTAGVHRCRGRTTRQWWRTSPRPRSPGFKLR